MKRVAYAMCLLLGLCWFCPLQALAADPYEAPVVPTLEELIPYNRELSLAEAIELAMEQNLTLESSRSSVESLSYTTSLVRSQWIPRVVVYGQFIHNDHETVFDTSESMAPLMELFAGLAPLMEALGVEPIDLSGGGEAEPTIIQHQEDYRAGGSVSVEFQPGSLVQYDSASLASHQGEYMIEQASLQIGVAVTELYYGLVTVLEMQEVARRNIEVRQLSLEHVQGRYDVGTVTELDLLRAQMSLEEAIAQLDQLGNSYEVLREQTAALLQTEPDFLVVRPPSPPALASVEEVWTRTETNHPQLRSSSTSWEIAQNSLEEVDWSWAPTLSAAFNVNAGRTTAMNDEAVRWNITLQASWPLFLGGARFAQRGQRVAEEQAAYLQHLEGRSTLATEIRTAFLDRAQLETDLELAQRQLAMAERALEMARVVYQQGIGNQLDLIQAETMYFATEMDVTSNEIAISRQNARIHAMTGELWVPEPSP